MTKKQKKRVECIALRCRVRDLDLMPGCILAFQDLLNTHGMKQENVITFVECMLDEFDEIRLEAR